ncbi:hypothetical protein CONPUDRAFT_159332 [Coniophora puteana RWD-64-598 SS2]|uniref:Uncharacterized protein n=1 Tax=Coniophora puteana (strain RWD-64-598) TaxID=741705 RepID=A0A5M3M8T2_CONPW|nr:uncharacterized protein CONPUDRAFT_159332 [Coniophora puteana RWD-64-598 SS2]EIW75200.1 hypothetical protein CONPUDRAFT_159332 [Coniophora puteana RWD-64-598 SS2]
MTTLNQKKVQHPAVEIEDEGLEVLTILHEDASGTKDTTRSRICDLPSELLARIMLTCMFLDFGSQDSQLILLTHVCWYWRSVALSYPHLWSYFGVDKSSNPDRKMVFLERSKSALLNINVNFSSLLAMDASLIKAIVRAIRQTSRLRCLELRVAEIDLFEGLLADPAPYLQDLKLVYQPEDHDAIWTRRIDCELFGRETPALRKLSLYGCTLIWGSMIFSGLTRLEIEHLFDDFQISTSEFLDTLNCCAPTLEVLKLTGCLAHATASSPLWTTYREAVKLPRLDYLHLDELYFSDFSHYLSCLDLPPTAHISVSHVDEHNPELDIPAAGSMLPERLFSPSDPYAGPSCYLRLLFIKGKKGLFGLTLCNKDVHVGKAPWYRYEPERERRLPLSASFRWPVDEDAGLSAYSRNLHKSLPLSDVHTLRLDGDYVPTERSFWEGLFLNATNVHHLFLGSALREGHLVSVLDALTPQAEESSEAGGVILLPRLAHLHISTRRVANVESQHVVDVLNARAHAGANVEIVTVQKSSKPRLKAYAVSIGATMVVDLYSRGQ